MDRMNLSSDEARLRVLRNLNTRYRRVTSAIGLIPSRRTQVSAVATIGNRNITFSGIEKVDAVIDKTSGKDKPLEEITHDAMIVEKLGGEPPTKFSIFSTAGQSVTIRLNCTPTTAFTLYADGLATSNTLTGANDTPQFAESFHDVLIAGAMADEYRKMEKQNLARDAEADYERRLSDLKMFLAKSAYLEIYAGKRNNRPFYERPHEI